MPELPEVEVTRRSVAQRIQGARIQALHLGKPLRWPLGCPAHTLTGRTIVDIGRRGKYVLMQLDAGVLLWHLGMSGRLTFAPNLPPPGPHDHVNLITDRGVLRLHDPRRFGAVVFDDGLHGPVAHKLLAHLGVEPLEPNFTLAHFHAELKQRRAPIKSVLLAGHVVVGVGNIYASEALFQAGIRPQTRADRLSQVRAERLRHAIVAVLTRAVEQGGSTLKDFRNAAGESGHFQREAAVYGRAGQPCTRCGTPIRKLLQGQRATYYCPRCQT